MRFQSEPTLAWLLYEESYMDDDENDVGPQVNGRIAVAPHEFITASLCDKTFESRRYMVTLNAVAPTFFIQCVVDRRGASWAVRNPDVKLSFNVTQQTYEVGRQTRYPHDAVTRCVDRLPLSNPLHSVLVADDLMHVCRGLESRLVTQLRTEAIPDLAYRKTRMEELRPVAHTIKPNPGATDAIRC